MPDPEKIRFAARRDYWNDWEIRKEYTEDEYVEYVVEVNAEFLILT